MIIRLHEILNFLQVKNLTCAFLTVLAFHFTPEANAVSRISTGSGNWSNPASWNPAGIPASADQISIQPGHTITIDQNSVASTLTVQENAFLKWGMSRKLTLSGGILVYGKAEIIEGDIELLTPGSMFKIGANGHVIWQPADNTAAGASLFLKSHENFLPTSTLTINRWYNYTAVPLGSVVTGNFGNLELNTLLGGLLYEWNQNNEFQAHKILGKLTIGQGWIVLDKSGHITNTEIGSIELNNVNSYLDLHSGDHPGSFVVKTGELTNIGGTLNGIFNGNGNIKLEVTGDVYNLGYIELIYNSGVANTGLGNASIKVDGKYSQSTGDFRGIFNLSVPNCGKADLEFGSLEIEGGIFMGQYACHTAAATSTIRVHGNVTMNVVNANSKLRWNGLTSLSGTNCNLKLDLIIEGDLIIKGNAQAEFTSSGSTGTETVIIKGESLFEGCTSSFNYGSHTTNLYFEKSLTVNGGVVYLSRTDGTLTADITANLQITAGTFTTHGGNGSGNLRVNGNFNQYGGGSFLHNNSNEPSGSVIYMTVMQDFNMQGGSLMYDNNALSTLPHIISLNGNKFYRSGNAVITSTVSGSNPVQGKLYFDNQGTTEYFETGASTLIQNIKQEISQGCTLKVMYGHLQCASTGNNSRDHLIIATGGTLDLGTHQIYSNGIFPYSGITANDQSVIKTAHPEGWYNGTSNAALRATGNMNFFLHENAAIEYNGTSDQVISGTGVGVAQSTEHQYGVLVINKAGSKALLNSSSVKVRTGLDLNNGELSLNGFNLTVASGKPSAIRSVNGYILSETNASPTGSMVNWQNIETGNHTIPFGVASNKLIPFSFTPTSGYGNTFSVATRGSAQNNRPLPQGITHINMNGAEAGSNMVIDRWYFTSGTGITATCTLSYTGTENTTAGELATGNFSVMNWQSSKWVITGGAGQGVTNGTGKVIATNNSAWGTMLLISNEVRIPADLLSFTATKADKTVSLQWQAIASTPAKEFIIERSSDGFNFSELLVRNAIDGDGSAVVYDDEDESPLSGSSWYRVKQNDVDGKIKYSNTVRVDFIDTTLPGLNDCILGPNPFTHAYTVTFNLDKDAEITIKMMNQAGQVVLAQQTMQPAGKNEINIDSIEQLAPGIYLISVSDGKNIKYIKALKF